MSKEEFVGSLDDEWNVVLDHDRPIVRCRDCVHFTFKEEFFADIGVGLPIPIATADTCGFWGGTKCKVEPDGFCAWGERTVDE